MVFGFLKKLGGNILSGLKTVGNAVLTPIRKVRDVGKSIYNTTKDIPLLGDAVQFGESMLPGVFKKGIGVFDNALDLGDKAMRGDLRGVIREGRDIYKSIRGSR